MCLQAFQMGIQQRWSCRPKPSVRPSELTSFNVQLDAGVQLHRRGNVSRYSVIQSNRLQVLHDMDNFLYHFVLVLRAELRLNILQRDALDKVHH